MIHYDLAKNREMHRRQIGAFENLEILKQSTYCLATLWLTRKVREIALLC